MTWLEFISSLATALAWPGAVLALALVLRKPLAELIPLLQRMKYRDFEMEFRRRVSEAREEAGVEDEASTEAEPTPEEARIIELAKVSPRAAVTEAWLWVEFASLGAAKSLLGEEFHNKSASYDAIRKLEQDERIERAIRLLMRDLRVLRNQAAHSPEFAISPTAALEYAQMARRLVGYLKSVSGPNEGMQRTAVEADS